MFFYLSIRSPCTCSLCIYVSSPVLYIYVHIFLCRRKQIPDVIPSALYLPPTLRPFLSFFVIRANDQKSFNGCFVHIHMREMVYTRIDTCRRVVFRILLTIRLQVKNKTAKPRGFAHTSVLNPDSPLTRHLCKAINVYAVYLTAVSDELFVFYHVFPFTPTPSVRSDDVFSA